MPPGRFVRFRCQKSRKPGVCRGWTWTSSAGSARRKHQYVIPRSSLVHLLLVFGCSMHWLAYRLVQQQILQLYPTIERRTCHHNVDAIKHNEEQVSEEKADML